MDLDPRPQHCSLVSLHISSVSGTPWALAIEQSSSSSEEEEGSMNAACGSSPPSVTSDDESSPLHPDSDLNAKDKNANFAAAKDAMRSSSARGNRVSIVLKKSLKEVWEVASP